MTSDKHSNFLCFRFLLYTEKMTIRAPLAYEMIHKKDLTQRLEHSGCSLSGGIFSPDLGQGEGQEAGNIAKGRKMNCE